MPAPTNGVSSSTSSRRGTPAGVEHEQAVRRELVVDRSEQVPRNAAVATGDDARKLHPLGHRGDSAAYLLDSHQAHWLILPWLGTKVPGFRCLSTRTLPTFAYSAVPPSSDESEYRAVRHDSGPERGGNENTVVSPPCWQPSPVWPCWSPAPS